MRFGVDDPGHVDGRAAAATGAAVHPDPVTYLDEAAAHGAPQDTFPDQPAVALHPETADLDDDLGIARVATTTARPHAAQRRKDHAQDYHERARDPADDPAAE